MVLVRKSRKTKNWIVVWLIYIFLDKNLLVRQFFFFLRKIIWSWSATHNGKNKAQNCLIQTFFQKKLFTWTYLPSIKIYSNRNYIITFCTTKNSRNQIIHHPERVRKKCTMVNEAQNCLIKKFLGFLDFPLFVYVLL